MGYRIEGGRHLYGQVKTQGSKNAALPILFAGLLVGGEVILENIPAIADVAHALAILRGMGATVDVCGDHVRLDTTAVHPPLGGDQHISAIRASSYLLGAGLARFGQISMPLPGGCDLGRRPLDLHRTGLEKLGADWQQEAGRITLCRKRYEGANITLPYPSVGATVNLLLAALGAEGESALCGCATERHVIEVVRFLRMCGAQIRQEGNCFYVKGGTRLHGAAFRIMPDGVEAGTYLIGAATCGGQVCVGPVLREEIRPLLHCFSAMGIAYAWQGNGVVVTQRQPFLGTEVVCAPYPGFPTDLHPQMSVLLAASQNGGQITDLVWRERFGYVQELKKTGMQLRVIDECVCVSPGRWKGATMTATDLRAGAAMMIAALAAEGESVIEGCDMIERGYEHAWEKWHALGAFIKKE